MTGTSAYRLLRRAKAKAFTTLVSRDFAAFGTASSIHPPFEVYGEERISIGDHVIVNPETRLFAWGPEGRIRIGNRVRISGHAMIVAQSSVEIGDVASIARGVFITDHNHAHDDPGAFIRDQGVSDVMPVRIGSGAWIGHNAVILRASVGDGAIVASGAVVTKDVPPRAVVAGVPAKVIQQLPV